MSLRPRSAALLLGIFLSTPFLNRLNAQTATSGAVTGVVTDQSGAVVPNANVEIRDVNKGTTESTRTDRDGVYRFFFLSPSQYTLIVEHDRFRKEIRSVTVLLETPVTVNITLAIATVPPGVTEKQRRRRINTGCNDEKAAFTGLFSTHLQPIQNTYLRSACPKTLDL